jgi:hypothetical protein
MNTMIDDGRSAGARAGSTRLPVVVRRGFAA